LNVTPLLAVPNLSEGRDPTGIDLMERAFASGVSVLDRHSDAEHSRTVFTLAGSVEALPEALELGAKAAIGAIDMARYEGLHPAIGVLDVCPLVWIDPADRDAAGKAAIEVADRIGALGVPVFFYGALASGPEHAERAYFRNGGLAELWLRMEAGELRPDRGPSLPHQSAGATLVTARPPLAAFNIELDSADTDIARAVAARLRESGGGPAGGRAIGLPLASGRSQISTNVHDPFSTTLGEVVGLVREIAAPLGARPVEAELVGLVPEAALAAYPSDVPIRGFDPAMHTIEQRLATSADR
jgi:glutamate formiminotransferase